MQQRYYDPVTGRFISPDPVVPTPGDVFNFNRFAYANNSPLRFIDPFGQDVSDLPTDRPNGCRTTRYCIQYHGHWVTPQNSPEMFERVLDHGHITLQGLGHDAKNISFATWVKNVWPHHKWDFKNARLFVSFRAKSAKNKKLLQAFGNFAYGLTGAANGIPLQVLLYGAGAAQVTIQSHTFGNTLNAIGTAALVGTTGVGLAVYGSNQKVPVWMAQHGLNWGDNPGGQQLIILGYLYYEQSH